LALLKHKDVHKAEQIKENFDKISRHYPYPCEIESERELIDIAEQAVRLETNSF